MSIGVIFKFFADCLAPERGGIVADLTLVGLKLYWL
jgi:hypothetical protein